MPWAMQTYLARLILCHIIVILKFEDCPTLSNKVTYLRDCLNIEHHRLLSTDEMIDLYPEAPRDEIEHLLGHVGTCITRFQIDLNRLDLKTPFRPSIASLIHITDKGCAKWTSLLRFKFGTTTSIAEMGHEIGQATISQFLGQNI